MGRRGLTLDEQARILLDARAGVLSVAVTNHEIDRGAAVVELSLLVPARPDIADPVIDNLTHAPAGLADWPPKACTLDLLHAARAIMSGQVELTDGNGVTVHHHSQTDWLGRQHRVLRVHRHGAWITDCPTSHELARHVDPASLRVPD